MAPATSIVILDEDQLTITIDGSTYTPLGEAEAEAEEEEEVGVF